MPDRLEFELASDGQERLARRRRPRSRSTAASLRRAGGRARPRRRGDRSSRRRSGRASPAISSAWPTRTVEIAARSRSKTCRTTDDDGKATLRRHARQAAGDRRARSRRRSSCAWPRPAAARSSASSTLPVTPAAPMIGVKPLFAGRSLGEGENATFDVIVVVAGRHAARAQRPALRTAQGRDPAINGTGATAAGTTSRSSRPRASPTARSTSPPTSRRASRCRCNGAATASKSRPAIATGR